VLFSSLSSPIEIRAAGYGAIWHGQKKSWNGVAILARGAEPMVRQVGEIRSMLLEIAPFRSAGASGHSIS
jgi:exonuclease III